MNTQLYLNVPFHHKERAKQQGARWDPAMRAWFVPHGLDINEFTEWWPDHLRKQIAQLGDPKPTQPKRAKRSKKKGRQKPPIDKDLDHATRMAKKIEQEYQLSKKQTTAAPTTATPDDSRPPWE